MPIRERMIPMNPYNKRERMRKCRQRWEAKNPNYRREYQRKWRQNNLEHCREYSRNYYARRKQPDPTRPVFDDLRHVNSGQVSVCIEADNVRADALDNDSGRYGI